jgi:NADPH:quinone reductase-like Zn-dependent oxidoreductase
MDALLDLYAKGAIRPVIYRTYPLREAAAALRALADRESHGKVVLAP